MAGSAISSTKTRMISLRVSASDSDLPSLVGSNSLLSSACCWLSDCFYCSLILASSISEPDLTTYL